MATVEFIHFCDYAFLDSNLRPCLMGIKVHIASVRFPMPVATLTVAIGLRVAAGEEAHIRVEIGPLDGKAQRSANLVISGPPADGPLTEGLKFLPLQHVSLYFARPHTLLARVIQGETILATRTLHLIETQTSGPTSGSSPT